LVLFGPGTVHALDDAEHRRLKAMSWRCLARRRCGRSASGPREWEAAVGSWAGRRRVVLFDEAVQVLVASVFPWAGVPSTGEDRGRRAEQLAAVL
jgi:fatty-acid peroxygenase